MGNKKKHKADKKRKHSSDNTGGDQVKNPRHGWSPPEKLNCNISVSETLHNANSVLFDNSFSLDNTVFVSESLSDSDPILMELNKVMPGGSSQKPMTSVPTPPIPGDASANSGTPTDAIIDYLRRIELK